MKKRTDLIYIPTFGGVAPVISTETMVRPIGGDLSNLCDDVGFGV